MLAEQAGRGRVWRRWFHRRPAGFVWMPRAEAEIEAGEAEPAGAGISGEQRVGEQGVGRTTGEPPRLTKAEGCGSVASGSRPASMGV